MNVAIAGPRDLWLTDADIQYAIDHSGFEPSDILTGDAKGVDASVVRWANSRNYNSVLHVYRAQWKVYGKKAGPLRNERMIREADALIAFIRIGTVVTPGTASAIAEAVVKGIPVFIAKVRGA